MNKAFKILGAFVSLTFVSIFTYLMFALIGLGFNDTVLIAGVFVGLVSIVYGMIDAMDAIGAFDFPNEEDVNDTYNELLEQVKAVSNPPLYYKIDKYPTIDTEEAFMFQVYSQNHELICQSDGYRTKDGAITGLWYLIDAMGRMDGRPWIDPSYEKERASSV